MTELPEGGGLFNRPAEDHRLLVQLGQEHSWTGPKVFEWSCTLDEVSSSYSAPVT